MKNKNDCWSQEGYLKAFRFAAEKHKTQVMPGTEWSYTVHLSMVCMEIMAAFNQSPNFDGILAVQAAILHDIIEDTDATYEEVRLEFGTNIADGVLALTKDKTIQKQDQMQVSLHRIKLQPKEIWMVKLADRITNLQEPPSYWNHGKKKRYLKQAELILDELRAGSEYLTQRLNKKIRAYQAYI
nr:HD domain-containing protein [uncultured Desulfobacter sp.]